MLIRFCIDSQTRGLAPRRTILLVTLLIFIHAGPLPAEDWPEWRGKGRGGVWKDTGILVKFPTNGLKAAWRTPIGGGLDKDARVLPNATATLGLRRYQHGYFQEL